MKICPTCLKQHEHDLTNCPTDDTALLVLGAGDPRYGKVELDRFLILDTIGRGGMGVVYQAWQISMRRPVALKVLTEEASSDAALVKRFIREAQVTAGLRSPHTITIFDFGSLADGSFFIAMEMLDGKPLDVILQEEETLEPLRVANLAIQMCLSLEEAHAGGLVHRDLKPGNVFVERIGAGREFVKVLDFGIVKLMDKKATVLTQAGFVSGTPAYMSPEQAMADDVGPYSDLYSLGVLLYEMLTGHWPFEADSPVRLMMKQIKEDPPPFSEHDFTAQHYQAFEPVVRTCLAKRPDDRYESMAELRKAIEKLVSFGMLEDRKSVVFGAQADTEEVDDATMIDATPDPAEWDMKAAAAMYDQAVAAESAARGGGKRPVAKTSIGPAKTELGQAIVEGDDDMSSMVSRPKWIIPAMIGGVALGVIIAVLLFMLLGAK